MGLICLAKRRLEVLQVFVLAEVEKKKELICITIIK